MRTLLVGVVAVVLALGSTAQAGKFAVLYSFQGGQDGYYPYGSMLARDAVGNLYGTTAYGGGTACKGRGCGTVFKLAVDGTESVFYAFKGDGDGYLPFGGVAIDTAGNLYGTTREGGTGNGGTVYKITAGGAKTTLYTFDFKHKKDGANPYGTPVLDKSGNLYGTNSEGGTAYGGTVFKIAPDGTETVLHEFTGGTDGADPRGDLLRDAAGNLYGTTLAGGGTGCTSNLGCGTVFALAPNGDETVLYAFCAHDNCMYGDRPGGTLAADRDGNLYGTTWPGATWPNGSVFRLAPDGTFSTFYAFAGGVDGDYPFGNLAFDPAGNLYGSTWRGGGQGCGGYDGCGMIYRLAPGGTKTTLHAFTKRKTGTSPNGFLLVGAHLIFGTTDGGGTGPCQHGCGTVFQLKP